MTHIHRCDQGLNASLTYKVHGSPLCHQHPFRLIRITNEFVLLLSSVTISSARQHERVTANSLLISFEYFLLGQIFSTGWTISISYMALVLMSKNVQSTSVCHWEDIRTSLIRYLWDGWTRAADRVASQMYHLNSQSSNPRLTWVLPSACLAGRSEVCIWKVHFETVTYTQLKRNWIFTSLQRGCVLRLSSGRNEEPVKLHLEIYLCRWTEDFVRERSFTVRVSDSYSTWHEVGHKVLY